MSVTFEEETVRKKKLTSVVWETFTPISSSGLRDGLIDSAKCSICNKIFSTRHGTSSMMRHAKRHNEFPNGTPIGKKGKKNANGAAANGVAAGKKAATQKKDTIMMPIDEQAGMKRQRMRNLSSALIEWIVEDQQDLGVVQHEKFLDVLAANNWGLGNKLLCGVTPTGNESGVGMGFLREKIKSIIGLDNIAPDWNVTCLGHLIHAGVLAALKEIRHEIVKLRSLLSLLKSTTESQEHFALRTTEVGLQYPDQLPNLDSPKNWKTTITMILESAKIKDTINALYGDATHNMSVFLLEEIEWDLLVWVATFLQKCMQMATCQSDQKHISLSTSINVCKAIVGLCESTAASASDFTASAFNKIQTVCLKVKASLESYHTEHSSPYFRLAKILDPRFSNESVDKAAKKTFLREMLRTSVYDALSDARLDDDQARHDASAAYTTFEKLLDIGEGMPDYTIDGDETNKLFKFNELARAWQIERQNFGRKRRRDSFDYLDPPLEPPAKLASYEESI
ncbi:hypothetical protein JG687_00007121 [Phytophthora cactorum]|uniref:BED-type domain-containing protein n=1 Tax=Phytophthora cactorum TaxID=29920 RepID=A0A8T1UJ65_9STRA|nr:hypothetical protein JG687_00007121 [Phytophthora cactorum]